MSIDPLIRSRHLALEAFDAKRSDSDIAYLTPQSGNTAQPSEASDSVLIFTSPRWEISVWPTRFLDRFEVAASVSPRRMVHLCLNTADSHGAPVPSDGSITRIGFLRRGPFSITVHADESADAV